MYLRFMEATAGETLLSKESFLELPGSAPPYTPERAWFGLHQAATLGCGT